ncbi:MAG: 3'-5' exonuclease [Candidatus Peribacteraceae bacterium]|nr:3'-5' exonuclease [Candidatus Peribacteraceae bacterium]
MQTNKKPSISNETRHAFRRPAIEMCLHLFDQIDYVLDLETTGLNVIHAEAIQVGVVELKTRHPIINDLLLPPIPIDKGATRVHGKDEKWLKDCNAEKFTEEYAKYYKSLLDGKVIAGYNVAFDACILDNMCVRRGFTPIAPAGWIDVMPIFNLIYGQWSTKRHNFAWQKLAKFNVEKRELHDAVTDCLVVCDYMHHIVNMTEKR